jgi:hypothetical protein
MCHAPQWAAMGRTPDSPRQFEVEVAAWITNDSFQRHRFPVTQVLLTPRPAA